MTKSLAGRTKLTKLISDDFSTDVSVIRDQKSEAMTMKRLVFESCERLVPQVVRQTDVWIMLIIKMVNLFKFTEFLFEQSCGYTEYRHGCESAVGTSRADIQYNHIR